MEARSPFTPICVPHELAWLPNSLPVLHMCASRILGPQVTYIPVTCVVLAATQQSELFEPQLNGWARHCRPARQAVIAHALAHSAWGLRKVLMALTEIPQFCSGHIGPHSSLPPPFAPGLGPKSAKSAGVGGVARGESRTLSPRSCERSDLLSKRHGAIEGV